MGYLGDMRLHAHTRLSLAHMFKSGEALTALTAYDATFASLLDRCGVDIILVGDSLGNVIQGRSSTLPVNLEDIVYHTSCVARGVSRAFVMADLPFGAYQEGPLQAFRSSVAVMKAGAHCVKLEGGASIAESVQFLVDRGIPVCGHLGLTPQSVHQIGGYKVQGRTSDTGQKLLDDACLLEAAGASFLVLELIPSDLALKIVTALTKCITIGIGASQACGGQILVMHDMLGLGPVPHPRFVKNFLEEAGSIEGAIKAYVADVKARRFPGPEHVYAPGV